MAAVIPAADAADGDGDGDADAAFSVALLLSVDQDEYGHKYPCVKARGIIEGSAAEVMGMIVDSTRVLEYNRWGGHQGIMG